METLFIITTLIVFICFTLAFIYTTNKNTKVLQTVLDDIMKPSQNILKCNLHEEVKKRSLWWQKQRDLMKNIQEFFIYL